MKIKNYFITVLLTMLTVLFPGNSLSDEGGTLLQIVTQPEERILYECPVAVGSRFYIDYIHSSDHTPVHDIFVIDDEGRIVLIEEDYEWYGAGLEFHPDANATISYEGKMTRVFLYRPLSRFFLRVGRVAGHRLTCSHKVVPLLSLAKGGELVWIRTVRKGVFNE